MSVTRIPSINLARRPFRNNTIHYVVFASCFALLAAASVYNVYDYVATGGEINRLGSELNESAGHYRELGDEVEKMKVDVGRLDLTTLNTKSNFANGLILSRLFSWSALFDRIEELIPPDVKIRSIRPAISAKGIEIQIDGMARTPQALYEFETALDGSDFFTGVYPLSENTRESKTELNFDIMMNYIPNPKSPTLPATPTEGLPVPEKAEGETGTEPGAAPGAAGGVATGGTPDAQAGAAGATTAPSAPAASQGPVVEEPAQPIQEDVPSGTIEPPSPGKMPPAMTNKEFLDAFGKERLIQVRGKFGVHPPIEHPELNNAEFIQKFGMEAFIKARGHLDRAAQILPPPAPVSGKGAPR